ncbi:MAG: hypothetical protein AB1635_20540 [Acidobacteriota bacterium]
MHLTHDELVAHYYGDADPAAAPRLDAHLAGCPACQAELARVRAVLALVESVPEPEPGPAYEREVWARLQDQLVTPAPWWRRLLTVPARWAVAGTVAAALIGAFLAGWLARGAPDDAAPAATTADAGGDEAPVRERVLLVAVGEHLDRTQMVLVEVMNADDGAAVSLASERERATDLVAANRLYRQTAAMAGDEALDSVLEELERVLLDIANGPADLTGDDLNALRARIESRGLLFRVRVLSGEIKAREQRDVMGVQRGTTS